MKKTYIKPHTKVVNVRVSAILSGSLTYRGAEGTNGNVESGCNESKDDMDPFGW